MIPAEFAYYRPRSLNEAVSLLTEHKEAKILAGGHSLIPAMKLRLAQPKVLVDLGRISELRFIREEDGRIALGAMTTHYEIESSELLRVRCPLLPEVARHIGDPQVRNRGTFAGSLAHADPAADWPAAALALEAEIEIAGPRGRRTVSTGSFLLDMFRTAVEPDEIAVAVRVPATGPSVAYAKFAQKASGFAIAGVAVVIDRPRGSVRVGVTGVAFKAYRAIGVETELAADLTPQGAAAASERVADEIQPLGDMHASPEYRAHLAKVMARRALVSALSRV